MKNKTYTNQKGNHTVPVAVAFGLGVSLLVTVLLSAALTSMVTKGTLQLENLQFIIFMIRAIAVTVGAIITTGLRNGKVLLNIAIVCAAYLVILISVTIIFYNGMFQNLGGGLLSVLAGGAAACLIRLKPEKRRKINRRYTK